MVLYIGRDKLKEVGPVAPARCQVCGAESWARLYKRRAWITLLSLPLVPLEAPSYELVCEACLSHKPIDGEDLELARDQLETTEALIAGEMAWEDYAETVQSFSAAVSDDLATPPETAEDPRGFA